jgi:hypothetical protein
MITLLFVLLQAADAQKTWEGRCASCHFVPDTSIDRDKVWLQLIKTTA